jgi:type II secretory pathway pseudopilin PulG
MRRTVASLRRLAARRANAGRRGERGYNMVVLMVLVTVLNVLVAAALPAWSAVIQRDKEQELIFRGLQYAEAIRVFQKRFGRLPVRLEELVEVEPRSIRRLWEDPLTGEARWGLIFAGTGAPVPVPGGGSAEGVELGGGTGLDGEPPAPVTNDPDQLTQGPISGVYSLAKGEPMIQFLGKDRYDEWQFTVELVAQVMARGGQAPDLRHAAASQIIQAPTIPDLSSRWIGRPWPRELQQILQQGGMPGQPPGVAPGPAQGGMPGQTPSVAAPRR